jgi:hypothetical protein
VASAEMLLAKDMVGLLRACAAARAWEKTLGTNFRPLAWLMLHACNFAPSNAEGTPAVKTTFFWDLVQGIDVLRMRDGITLMDAQILERAANIYAGLTGNYKITPLD